MLPTYRMFSLTLLRNVDTENDGFYVNSKGKVVSLLGQPTDNIVVDPFIALDAQNNPVFRHDVIFYKYRGKDVAGVVMSKTVITPNLSMYPAEITISTGLLQGTEYAMNTLHNLIIQTAYRERL